MRDLAYDFFQRSPVMIAPLFAMLAFLAVFVAVMVRALRAARTDMDRAARLALVDEKEPNDVQS